MAKAPHGIYLDGDQWVMVEYGTHQAPLPRDEYEESGYEPPYVMLPSKEDYERARIDLDAQRL